MAGRKEKWTDEKLNIIKNLSDEIYKDLHSMLKAHFKISNHDQKEFIFEQAVLNALIKVSAEFMFHITDGSDNAKSEFVEMFEAEFLKHQEGRKFALKLNAHLDAEKSHIEEALKNCENVEEAKEMLGKKIEEWLKNVKEELANE
jgi:hypothetical protein